MTAHGQSRPKSSVAVAELLFLTVFTVLPMGLGAWHGWSAAVSSGIGYARSALWAVLYGMIFPLAAIAVTVSLYGIRTVVRHLRHRSG